MTDSERLGIIFHLPAMGAYREDTNGLANGLGTRVQDITR